MQQFLEYVLRQLVDYPDEMVVTCVETPKRLQFNLRLRQTDVGKVIGKHGQTIAAVRNLLAAAASRHGQTATVEIIEPRA